MPSAPWCSVVCACSLVWVAAGCSVQQLLNHFVETVKKKTLAAQKGLMKSSGDPSSDSASGTAVMVRKSRAITSGSNEVC